MIALQYHEVKINIELRPLDECLFAVEMINTKSSNGAYNKSLVAASLFVDYVFLDTDERRRMAQNPHEYLIEQLQFTGDESIGSSSNKIKLNFNHPCKELVWVVQKDSVVNYCDAFGDDTKALNNLYGAQPFNYTDTFDALPRSLLAFNAGQSQLLKIIGYQWRSFRRNRCEARCYQYLWVSDAGFSFLPKLSFCTAGVKIPLSLPSSSLTARIASLNVKEPT